MSSAPRKIDCTREINIPTARVPFETAGSSAKMDRAHSRVKATPATLFLIDHSTSACTTNFRDLEYTSLNLSFKKLKKENSFRSATVPRPSIYPRSVDSRRVISVMSCLILYCASALFRAIRTIGTAAARITHPASGAFHRRMTT